MQTARRPENLSAEHAWKPQGEGTMASWDTAGNTGTSGYSLGTKDNLPLVMITANVEKVRIDASGNVGVGTMQPACPLRLATGKALRIEGATSPTDSANYFSFGGY